MFFLFFQIIFPQHNTKEKNVTAKQKLGDALRRITNTSALKGVFRAKLTTTCNWLSRNSFGPKELELLVENYGSNLGVTNVEQLKEKYDFRIHKSRARSDEITISTHCEQISQLLIVITKSGITDLDEKSLASLIKLQNLYAEEFNGKVLSPAAIKALFEQ